MTKPIFNVALDGPAGAGKSTMARAAAKRLQFVYVDTGAIYRTIAFAVLQNHIDPADAAAVAALLPTLSLSMRWAQDAQHMLLGGEDVTDRIRQPEISRCASHISAQSAVRDFLLETQRAAARENSVIMDGRDIGTVVLPDADVKIFLTASAEVRAKRRFLELGGAESYEAVLRDMTERDWRDTHREIAPLRQAQDAVVLDTSELTLDESIETLVHIIREKLDV